jgi:alcohol dehydrogenase (cytochrome c)
LVNNGVIFTTSGNDVVALDAAGKLIWRHDSGVSRDLQLQLATGGVTVWGDKVFVAQADGNLVALNARTGEVAWSQAVGDYANGNFVTMMPLAVNGKLFVSTSGAGGAGGVLDAFDADTGGQLWRTYSNNTNVPRSGGKAWKSDLWNVFSGSIWSTANYDPKTETIFWGEADSSTVALDPYSGSVKWSALLNDPKLAHSGGELVGLVHGGDELAIHPTQDGYVSVYERSNGRIVNVWPIEDSGSVCPATAEGIDWNIGTYSAYTALYYQTSNRSCVANVGSQFKIVPPPDAQIFGHLDARDPITGKISWKVRISEPTLSSVLSTAGGLVFMADAIGVVHAYDAKTGVELWKHDNGLGHQGGIISYEANGKQYILVDAGLSGPIADSYEKLFGKRIKTILRGERRLIVYSLK